MEKIKISFMVPIYNAEKYLEESINSIINQTYKNLEIVLVNDGSTDNSLNICNKFREKDNRIIIINQENKGVSGARNIGIQNMTGLYGIQVDADDTIEVDACEKLVKLIEEFNYPDFVSFGNYTLKDNNRIDNKKFSGRKEEFNPRDAYINCMYGKGFGITPWSRIAKVELMKKVVYPEGMLSEDQATGYEYFELSKNVVYYDEHIYNYYLRDTSIMGTLKESHIIDVYNIYEKKYNLEKEKFPKEIRHINTIYINNLLKVYVELSQKNSSNQEIKDKCTKIIHKMYLKEKVELKTFLAMSVFMLSSKLFLNIMNKKVNRGITQ